MPENDKNSFGNDDFWNLDEFAVKKRPLSPQRQFPKSSTEAVEISENNLRTTNNSAYSDSKLSSKDGGGTITRFIPPHKDSVYAKKHILFEYESENPLIKSIKIYSDKQDGMLFPVTNLFMRERRALLSRKAQECPYAAYYSYSPRYSQMSRAQLSYYLWWRENTRNGIFLKADESYIILYAYELAACEEGEDKQSALNMLCDLMTNYTDKDINVVFKMMIRDIICDFCLIHALTPPLHRLKGLGRQLFANAFLPEFFIDLSEENREAAMEVGLSALSMYDFRKSKIYTPESSSLFKKAMTGALAALITDTKAFEAITSFTNGVYGCVTAERRPFSRMINIVNKGVWLEVTYFQLANIQSAVTDAMRHSENRLREHMGVKNKLHIMGINPDVKRAIDEYFDANYPSMPIIDRRRKAAKIAEEESHEYDRFYDVPKSELSTERALEIERESWDTTKILTEAFSDEKDIDNGIAITPNAPELIIEPIISVSAPQKEVIAPEMPITTISASSSGGLSAQIKAVLGNVSDFIALCVSPSSTAQRAFAQAHGLSVDEIADKINETAVDIFGDIILEDVGSAYGIIEDYIDQI